MGKDIPIFLLLLIFCTACAGTALPTATIQPTLTVTLTPAPPQTPTPTATPASTATPTPTATTTYTATPTFEPLDLNTNPTNIYLYTRITMEDITSGRFAEANRKLAQPFPENTFIGGIVIRPSEGLDEYGRAAAEFPESITYRTDPQTRPTRWLSFNVMDVNGEDYIVAGMQMLNSDGTYGVLPIMFGSKDGILTEGNGATWQRLLKTFLTNSSKVSLMARYANDCKSVRSVSQIVVCEWYKEGNQGQLVTEWAKTGVLPTELEKMPVGQKNTAW